MNTSNTQTYEDTEPQSLPLLTRHFGGYGDCLSLSTIISETKETMRSTVKAIRVQLDLLTSIRSASSLKNIEIGLLNNLRRIEWIDGRVKAFKTLKCCESEVNDFLNSTIYLEYLDLCPSFERECNGYFNMRIANTPLVLRSGMV